MTPPQNRDDILNEALKSVRDEAIAALEGADEGAFQKSDTLKQIAEKIRVALIAAEKAEIG
jgi:Tfp pilus assembly protein FimV